MKIPSALKAFIPSGIYTFLRYCKWRALAFSAALRERNDQSHPDLPPPLLRARVHGDMNAQAFIQAGVNLKRDLEEAVATLGRELYSFPNIFDFGCGCGRVIRQFKDKPEPCRIFGSDIDAEAIKFCESHLPFASFRFNQPLPPLPFNSSQFELIYAISVFTHIDKSYQAAWLQELQRVAAPGAILLLSTHGAFASSVLPEEKKNALKREGFFFSIDAIGRFKPDGLPDFYQATYQTREYTEREWSKFFRILGYREQGINNHQDLVIMAKN